MNAPCYNKETHFDCPNRRAGCQTSCEAWKQYLAERDKLYEERRTSCIAYQSRQDAVAKAMRRKYLQGRK
jgi:hypothetical protein